MLAASQLPSSVMTKTLMILAELVVINWVLILAASLIKAKAWKPSGLLTALGNRDTVEDCSGFPARTERAARNMLENMVLFTALVLVATVGVSPARASSSAPASSSGRGSSTSRST